MTRCLTCATVIPRGSRCSSCQRRRNAERNQQRGGWDWLKTKAAILERDHHRCQDCGNTATVVDHIVPLFLGGSNAASNLRSLCVGCHRIKTNTDRRRLTPGRGV